ncbi:hypothetical protein D3C80_1126460 [compost metagenome]
MTKTTSTEYNGNDSIATVTSKSYDSYNQPSVLITSSSNPNIVGERVDLVYPYNYSDIPIFLKMKQVNRLADVVSLRKYYFPKSSIIYGFDKSFTEVEDKILESKVTIEGILEPTESRELTYDKYDSQNANLLQYTSKSIVNSVIWDYNSQYPVAKAINSSATNCAYTSFEADGKGNWSFTGSPTADPISPTGKMCYSLSNGPLSKTDLNSELKFLVSYWAKTGASVNITGGTLGQLVTGRSYNNWTYYERLVSNATIITISGTGLIDEVRLYPADAQMTTYTYEPLIGITSATDAKGQSIYYEYDYFQRLKVIKDQDRNIIKAFNYNYKH